MQEIKYRGRNCGTYFKEKHLFITHRDESHIFRMFNGLGISYEVIRILKGLGCWRIVILLHRVNGTTEKYEATIDRFIKEGKVWRDKSEDYQRILSFEQFSQYSLLNTPGVKI